MFAQPPTETLFETYLQPWKKYAQFWGRASRREYWTFTLINAGIYLALVIVSAMLGAGDPSHEPSPMAAFLQLVYFGFWLGALLPGLAVSVRRLHDTNRSGWWLLLCMVCGIILLVFGLLEGDRGPNQYGPDPYEEGSIDRWRLTPPLPNSYADLNTPRPMETWRTRDED
jgi:uncharacterized membrane protein YhaH (DUF805 family)